MLETINRIQTVLPHLIVLCLPLVETAMRLFPTLNKLSMFYTVGDILQGMGELSHHIGDALNSVIPQTIKTPASPAEPAPAPVTHA